MLGPVGRLRALDGLRGIAALEVVLHHSSILAEPYLHFGGDRDIWWYISNSPLRVFTAGHEAVLVFFVLSGLVLTRSAFAQSFRWSRYYVARLLRLYLPVWGAVMIATVLILLVPRDPSTLTVGGGWSTLATATSVTPGAILSEATLTTTAPRLDNVLWSLVWEVVFSALLPLAVLIARLVRTNSGAVLVALGAFGVDLLGQVLHVDALVYLPVFVFGVVIAARLDDLVPTRMPRLLWVTMLATSIIMLVAVEITPSPSPGLFDALSGVGAGGLVLCVAVSPPLARPFEWRVPQWLGRISFSLYLVHAPVLVAGLYFFGDAHWWLALLIGLPVAFTLAALFYRLVERPSHRLARRVGDVAAALVSRRRSPRSYPDTRVKA